MNESALERRYRRMLIWFPAEHRRIYGEEMIGVLLTSASGGENRPGLADMTDIAMWGLRTRLRGWLRAGRVGSEWGDALAAFAVAAPLLMTALAADQLYKAIRFGQIVATQFPQFSLFQGDATAERTAALLILAATLATVAALAIGPALARRGQRLAVTITATVPVLLGAAAVIYFDILSGSSDLAVGYTAFFVTELLAVVLAPNPARGWQVLSRKGLVIAVAVGAVTVATEELLQHGVLNSLNRNVIEVTAAALGIALIGVFGSTAHKRMLALLAIIAYPVLAYSAAYNFVYGFSGDGRSFDVLYLPTLAIAVLVGLAIWRSSRRPATPEVPSGPA